MPPVGCRHADGAAPNQRPSKGRSECVGFTSAIRHGDTHMTWVGLQLLHRQQQMGFAMAVLTTSRRYRGPGPGLPDERSLATKEADARGRAHAGPASQPKRARGRRSPRSTIPKAAPGRTVASVMDYTLPIWHRKRQAGLYYPHDRSLRLLGDRVRLQASTETRRLSQENRVAERYRGSITRPTKTRRNRSDPLVNRSTSKDLLERPPPGSFCRAVEQGGRRKRRRRRLSTGATGLRHG